MTDEPWYEQWPNLLEYIRQKDYYREVPYCDKGHMDRDFDYIIVHTSGDGEVCVTGWHGRGGLREGLEPDDSGWMTDSIWYNDKRIRWRMELIIEEE